MSLLYNELQMWSSTIQEALWYMPEVVKVDTTIEAMKRMVVDAFQNFKMFEIKTTNIS